MDQYLIHEDPAFAAGALVPEDAEDAAGAIATDKYAKTARYRTEYPEDIDLVGLSFNTMLGRTGIALQGEFSYRWDAPIQVDDVELLYATLGAIEQVVAENNQVLLRIAVSLKIVSSSD